MPFNLAHPNVLEHIMKFINEIIEDMFLLDPPFATPSA
jgi:hypothetical protein